MLSLLGQLWLGALLVSVLLLVVVVSVQSAARAVKGTWRRARAGVAAAAPVSAWARQGVRPGDVADDRLAA